MQNQTQAEEEYVVSSDVFQRRYEHISDLDDGRAEFKPIGKVFAVQLTNTFLVEHGLPGNMQFEAPWGELQVAYLDDFIVTMPDFSEVYRIGKKEFNETYSITNKT